MNENETLITKSDAEPALAEDTEMTERSAPLPSGADDSEARAELEARITHLEAELAKSERRARAREEFCRIFPDSDPDDLPVSVIDDVASGVPLAAAFALYKHKRQLELERALEANARNAQTLPHAIDGCEDNNFFSADSVRSMSQAQIRENFSHILNSMKHWN